jgi:uncharacterized protein
MNQTTGKSLETLAHIQQSIRTILTTPLGSRCLNRTFGSTLHQWLDAPFNPATQARLVQATATALSQWEPRIRLEHAKVALDPSLAGGIRIDLQATVLADGRSLTLEGIRLQ